MKNIIVISAHPDDEVLGAGGALLKHKTNGDNIFWLIATNMSEAYGYDTIQVERRTKEIQNIAKMLNIKKVFCLDYPPMELTTHSSSAIIKKISTVFQEVEPEIIYMVNRTDAHSDHRYLAEAVFACTKSFRYPYIRKVLMYECISETEFAPQFQDSVFIPNYFIDITSFIEQKLDLMKIYQSELGNHPFPRNLENIRALALYRGAITGVKYAEAFQVVKIIEL